MGCWRAIRSWRRSCRAASCETGAARDFTVKVDATGLEPGTTYYYRFESLGARSAIGRTRTLPAAGVSRLRLGVVSCSNLPQGYFNAYALPREARRPRRDPAPRRLLLRISPTSSTATAPRWAASRRPTRKSSRCRTIASGTRSTRPIPIRRTIHRQHPFIVTWDDHEFANNTWWGGAENHTPATEGEWTVRRAAAVQAYYEWMPIREDAQTLHAAHLSHVPLRRSGHAVHARHAPGRPRSGSRSRGHRRRIELPSRQLLGAEQEGWLAEQFVDIGAEQIDAGTCSASR